MKVDQWASVVLVLAMFSVVGCVTQPMYSWGTYEMDLYRYYKSPDDIQLLSDRLLADFEKAEKKGYKVPPGLYAEYGYLLVELEQPLDAVPYFKKEKTTWPESTLLMDKMIASVQE